MPGNSTELRNLSNTNFGSSLPDAASKTNGPSSGPALAVDPISAVDPRSAIDPASAIEDPLQDTQTYPDGGWKAYSVVLGSHLGLLVHFGVLNSVGAVQAYVSNHQLAGEKVSSVSWVFSIYMCIPFFLGALVGPVFDRKGSTILLACSTILLFVGFLALSFSKSIVAFIFSLSLCLGTAHALAIPPLVSSLSHWFLANRGKAIGLASLGGSVGGTIWPLVLQALYSSVGFAWAIRIVGAVAVCLSVSSVILVKSRLGAAERQNKTVTEKTTEQRASQKASQRVEGASEPPHKSCEMEKRPLSVLKHLNLEIFRDRRFASLVAGVFFTEIALLSEVTYLASYALAHGFSEKNSLLLLTIFNAAGVPGRYISGYFADRYGNLNTMVLMLVGFCLSIFVVWLPFGGHPGALYSFAAFSGFFSSSILSLTPVCLGSFTPVDMFGRSYGLMYTFSSTGILFGIPVGSAIIGSSSIESYRNFTVFCGAFAIAGTTFWCMCRYFIIGLKFNCRV